MNKFLVVTASNAREARSCRFRERFHGSLSPARVNDLIDRLQSLQGDVHTEKLKDFT